jgi:hypothetical protein
MKVVRAQNRSLVQITESQSYGVTASPYNNGYALDLAIDGIETTLNYLGTSAQLYIETFAETPPVAIFASREGRSIGLE